MVTIETDTSCLVKESNSYYRNRHRLPGEGVKWLLHWFIETDTGCVAKSRMVTTETDTGCLGRNRMVTIETDTGRLAK
jgi:hypothetical protein